MDILTARPGIVIGRRGAEVDKLREELQLLTKKDILLNIVEVRKPELDAKLVADSIARQLEGRVSFRRAMKKSLAGHHEDGRRGHSRFSAADVLAALKSPARRSTGRSRAASHVAR